MAGAIDWHSVTDVAGYDVDRQARAIRKDRPVKAPTPELRQGVVTGVDVPNGRCTIRLGGDDTDIPTVKHMSNYRPKVDDSCWVLVNQYDLLVLDRTTNLGPSVISDAQTNTVLELDTTTSTNWSVFNQGPNLSGISVSPSGRLLVQVSAFIGPVSGSEIGCYMSVLLTHNDYEFTVYPDDTSALFAPGGTIGASKVILFTNLPAGSYNATSLYRCGNGAGMGARNRHIWALPL